MCIRDSRYTEQNAYKKRSAKRTNGVKLSRMAFSNLGRNRRRSAFIIISLLLCIVLFNSIIIVTQKMCIRDRMERIMLR